MAGVGGDHLSDLGNGETELAPLEDEPEVALVGLRIDAAAPLARRREQALALVEPQGARGEAELVGHLADGEGLTGGRRRGRRLVVPRRVRYPRRQGRQLIRLHVRYTYK